jgi:hypothetical protein
MSISKTRIDDRPFRSKADQAREAALQRQYRGLAIPAVVAALQADCRTAVDRAASPSPGRAHREVTAGVVGLA